MTDPSDFSQIESDDVLPDWSAISTRLKSFRAFPHSNRVPSERLARAGFYFTGEADRVCCYSCRNTIENWRQGDDPVERHLKVSPSCTFLKCVHHRSLEGESSSRSHGFIYDEEREDMEYRIRTGEVVDESVYPKIPHMKTEDARLDTFREWPSSCPVQPRDLAQAGFFYVPETNVQTDRVQCFCCGGMLVNWEEGDDPWREHSKVYPNCFFILGHDVGNIPSEQLRERSQGSSHSMESFEQRLESFRDRSHPINHVRLARAGFSSTGDRDCVVCFRCGGRLKSWQPDEDPWEEHARHYPGCSFLLAEKGQEFINNIQLRNRGRGASNGFSSHEAASNVPQSEVTSGVLSSDSDLYHNSLSEDPLRKLEEMQREKLCKVCLDRDIAIVFIPCGHLVTCQKCSEILQKCPICCGSIEKKVMTYSS